ncbi:ATP-binding protein [Peribacillus simplex]|uniref:ATP-binding protein n=1 Tax=Peribacillus simplex TaxID=1478 RepID=UPI0011A1E4DC|nr:ATP-binding protein [Peribacillus simplex]
MDKSIINANPTKNFFISMLVRDIPLVDAIADLVDNSVDGATRLKGKDTDYSGLHIDLRFDKDKFEIIDNCGGFSTEIAAKYAFRFGRPEEAENDFDYSIGRFGVGMKRALFKIGNFFTVSSTCDQSDFKVTVDVNDWKRDKSNDWQFKFSESQETPSSQNFGTSIIITNLHQEVSELFTQADFINVLKKELKASYEKKLERKLTISINGEQLEYTPSVLLISDTIKPAFQEINLENGINAKIYVGISEKGSPKKAGWYVYCNDRLVLEADQTAVTGWGDGLPMSHNRFARFRGYVFINSEDTNLLPWNTTKNGVDQDSLIYRGIRLEMIKMGKSVITFLNDLVKENIEDDDQEELVDVSLTDEINKAEPENVSLITPSELKIGFQAPRLKKVRKPQDNQKIQYSKPATEISKVKEALNVSTLKEVGEKTFEYFYKLECED